MGQQLGPFWIVLGNMFGCEGCFLDLGDDFRFWEGLQATLVPNVATERPLGLGPPSPDQPPQQMSCEDRCGSRNTNMHTLSETHTAESSLGR